MVPPAKTGGDGNPKKVNLRNRVNRPVDGPLKETRGGGVLLGMGSPPNAEPRAFTVPRPVTSETDDQASYIST